MYEFSVFITLNMADEFYPVLVPTWLKVLPADAKKLPIGGYFVNRTCPVPPISFSATCEYDLFGKVFLKDSERG